MELAIFVAGAVAALAGALGIVLARNPVHSALFLLMTMATMAVFFLLQDADLVALIQIVVYASAIVVLFIFVITLLGVDQHEKLDEPHPVQRWLGIPLGVVLFGLVLAVARNDWVTGQQSVVGPLDGDRRSGNVRQLAESLFTDYVWAFEITAVLLVIAVVGGVVLARRSGHRAVREGEQTQ